MKRLFYFLACVLPVLAFTSCDDDVDLPDVDFELEVTNGTIVDGKIYAVAGEVLTIDGLKVTNNEKGKSAGILYADYYWNMRYRGRSVCPPNGFAIQLPKDTEEPYLLEIYAPVYAEDKDAAFAYLVYTVQLVKSAEDLPANGAGKIKSTPEVKENDTAPAHLK